VPPALTDSVTELPAIIVLDAGCVVIDAGAQGAP